MINFGSAFLTAESAQVTLDRPLGSRPRSSLRDNGLEAKATNASKSS